jgi:hypothetical protein
LKTRVSAVVLAVIASGCSVQVADGAIAAYDECSIGSTAQCQAGTGCFTISVEGTSAGLCTDFCTVAAECPIDARGVVGECLSFDGGASFTCFERCAFSSDCAPGWACHDAAGGQSFPPICLPI